MKKKNKQKELNEYVEKLLESEDEFIKRLENEETRGAAYSELKIIFYDSLTKEQKLLCRYLKLAHILNVSSVK